MKVIGAGLGRTGTLSLKFALEQLLGSPVYHMAEVLRRREDVEVWRRALHGEEPDWHAFFEGYAAAVDWPAAAFWDRLLDVFPDAIVVLSVRSDADAWLKSARASIDRVLRLEPKEEYASWHEMSNELLAETFTPVPFRTRPTIQAYHAHNDRVRAIVPEHRLVEWQPQDGWEPLCSALSIPVPSEAFPRRNDSESFAGVIAEIASPAAWRRERRSRRVRAAASRLLGR